MIRSIATECRSLDGTWSLYIAEHNACAAFADTLATEEALGARGFLRIAGSVPGNFELDMQRAGLLPDLFFGENTLLAQELENRHLWYVRRFCSDASLPQLLTLEGVDTFADVYLNGERVGTCDNMLIAHRFPVTPREGENELVVHVKPTCLVAREERFDAGIRTFLKYNAPAVTVRKASHTFGWDIMPRIVSGGLWRPVTLTPVREDAIEDVYLATEGFRNGRAKLYFYYALRVSGDLITAYTLRLHAACGESRFSYQTRLFHTESHATILVEDPVLWWPSGMGEPNLYDVTVELWQGEQLLDCRSLSFGIRTVELINSEYIDDEGNGDFSFAVNGERMYARGTNWVPLDAFHSRDAERLPMALSLLKECNCNMVRLWGGNVYESDEFYDFCDRNGIAVWQDFAMACSYYPQTERFCKALEREATEVVHRLRNHTSLFLWAGDNECDFCRVGWGGNALHRPDPKHNRLTREVLPEVIRAADPYRDYLPSSPYISERTYARGAFDCIPEHHLWGPRGYYKADFYTKAVARFVSETGYHGCPSLESMRKFLPEESLWPWQENKAWLVHAACMETDVETEYTYRIALMASQITHAFGVEAQTPEEFVLLSQLTQAEADKFFIERNRLGKWEKGTGILYWNLIDGWPQFSDAVVDYYGEKKLAYHVIRDSFRPVALMCREPQEGVLPLVGVNDTLCEVKITYRVTELKEGKLLQEGEAILAPNANTELCALPIADPDATAAYLLTWTEGGETYQNHYLAGKAPLEIPVALAAYRARGLVE